MKRCFSSWYPWLMAGTLLLPACRTASTGPSQPPAKTPVKGSAKKSEPSVQKAQRTFAPANTEAYARFATGVSRELNEQPEAALDEFYQSAMADAGNEPLVVELARRFLVSKQTPKALELLNRAVKEPNASGTLYGWLARAQLQNGQTNIALQTSQLAIRKEPTALSGYMSLAEVYQQSGRPQEILPVIDQAARQSKASAPFLIGLVDVYWNYIRNQPKEIEAVKKRLPPLLDRAAAAKSEDPLLVQRLADHYFLVGKPEKAAELYLQLVEAYPDLPAVRDLLREKLATLYLQSNNKPQAMAQLQAIIRENPTRYPQAYYFLGGLAFEEKEYEKAVEYYARALVLNPAFEQGYYDLALAQISLDQSQEALKTLAKAREKFPQRFATEFFSALAQVRMKHFTEALGHFAAAEVIDGAAEGKRLNALFYFQYGAASERAKDFEGAAKLFTKAIEKSPDFAEALNYLGYMWAERGENLPKALELIERAIQVEPKNPAYLDSLGWAYFKLNNPKKALDAMLQAVTLNEQPDATLYDHLGDIYQALGEKEKARDAWKKSLSIEASDAVKTKLESP